MVEDDVKAQITWEIYDSPRFYTKTVGKIERGEILLSSWRSNMTDETKAVKFSHTTCENE